MSMFNDISCDRYDKDDCFRECRLCENILKKRFGIGQWSFIGPSSEKKWSPSEIRSTRSLGPCCGRYVTKIRRKWTSYFPFNDSIVQRKVEKEKKVSIHFTADQDTVDTIYRIILSVNQLSVYGAVAAICEEFEDHQDRTGQLVILVGQSIVLGEIKAEALFAR